MKDRIKISFIILCLLAMTQYTYAEDNNKDLDIGKTIFKKEKKAKKIKVKPEKKKKEYKIKDSVIQEYSIPTDIYMNVGEKSDKTVGEIPEGTYDSYNWFEFDEKVYRLYSRQSIALVDGYYGSGTILEIDTEAKEFLYDVISYYPYTTYNGEYSDGKIVFKKVF